MFYLLFFFYLGLGCFFIVKNSFIKNSQLAASNILALFLLKIAAGVFFGYTLLHVYPGNDAWALNAYGNQEYQLLTAHPGTFFTDIFKSNYGEHYGSLFSSTNSYWNDLKLNILIKVVAILNIFSRGNYYINSLFFNFFCFFGHIALYRIFIKIYPGKKWLIIAGCFLLPSTLFFSSGMDKDCIIFGLIGMLCYCLYFSLENGFNLKKNIGIFLSIFFLFLLRNYIVVIMILPAVAWIINKKYHQKIARTFIVTFVFSILVLVLIQLTIPAFSPLKIVVNKQRDFFTLPIANTQLDTDTLLPQLQSFLSASPKAFNNAFIQPYPFQYSSSFLNIASFEIICYFFLFFAMLFYKNKSLQKDPFISFSIVFAILMLLFIGFIVPNAGSIVRYRSIYLPLLIIPLLCSIKFNDWSKKD
ncbi:MAG: hypothetical protein ABIP30_16905 [Ferruginibacter sp.]